jgi:6-phosphogluconolactonase
MRKGWFNVWPALAITFALLEAPLHAEFAYVANIGSKNNGSNRNVSGYTIDSTTGALTPITGSPFAAGTNPGSVAVDPSGKFAYVANEGGNNVSGYTIDPVTGALTPITGSPFAAGTIPDSVAVDPSGKFAYAANNLSHNVSGYTIDPTSGALTPITGSPFAAGTDPVSVAVDPERQVRLCGELLFQ